VSGFKSRNGRGFRAHLALSQDDEGKWRVEFNEAWAKDGAAKPPESATEETDAEEAVAA
jgi:DNA topoisomerase-3